MSPTIDEQEAGRDQPQSERRRRRSLDPITALHYQLAATRQSGSLQAVVLVDDSGCLVAGAGAWPLCEELAAYAPLFSEPRERLRTMVSMRVADLSLECESRMLSIDGQSVFLCARGSSDVRADALSRAAAGVRRILLAA
ncbi:MAG: hypothetical protein HOW73_02965 [Polyangiaceae bacterium]|nr:hypothetical protein [Polyangiaceae bacterium]